MLHGSACLLYTSDAADADGGWDRRDASERASAAGPAAPAALRLLGDLPQGGSGAAAHGRPSLLLNPKNFPWTAQQCNVHWSDEARLLSLQRQWFNQSVGDGADVVARSDLDPWQKFAYDIVCNCPSRLESLRGVIADDVAWLGWHG